MKLYTKAVGSAEMTGSERRNRDVAYRAALEGIVLLKNDGALPVRPGKIALFGSGAQYTIKGGSGSGEVNERYSVTILEGFLKAGFDVTNRTWLEDYQADYREQRAEFVRMMKKKFRMTRLRAFSDEALATMFQPPFGREITTADVSESDTDICVYVMSRLSGEGKDRNPDNFEFHLSEDEIGHLRFCGAHYKSTILIVNTGASMDLGALESIGSINAVVFFCMQGTEGGTALADIVSGKVCPSGRLTSTWVRSYDDVPYGREYGALGKNPLDADYREGVYVGYRYYDSFGVEPRYPFGFGLSYTEFDIRCLNAVSDRTRIRLTVSVTNTGSCAGKEVVQVYVSCPAGALDKPYQQLEAFAKTVLLDPGASQTVELDLDLTAAASFSDIDDCFVLEKGDYIIRIGNSSRRTVPCAVVRLDGDAVVSRHVPIVRGQPVTDVLCHEDTGAESVPEDIICLTVRASDIVCRTYAYNTPPRRAEREIAELMARMTADDCIALVVGDGTDLGGKFHSLTTPGAAGYTTPRLLKKGVPDVSLSDGPAGLRLQKISALTKRGRLKPVELPLALYEYFPDIVLKFLLGNPRRSKLLYQFTTAFPVPNALGMTWNVGLLEAVGRAIGAEMAEYGTTFWLAPGMNIHRSPLCGRNFEYFGEDPVHTGRAAAALVTGVQSTGGVYATLKHFCCNNQESARRKVSANVGERALREIYLRGFGIAVREAKPGGVMTAYNRINGVYAANSYEINTMVLRNEWSFDGIVMTDWGAASPGAADPVLAMSAGNDLLMPGHRLDRKALRTALKRGTLTEDDLRRCASNILRSILNSRRAREEQA